MSISLSAPPHSTPFVTRDVPPAAAVTVMAVVVAGFAAAMAGANFAWLVTPVVAIVILRAALGSPAPSAAAEVDMRELPVLLQHRVNGAFDRLPDGEARRLLKEVLVQARPLYAARATAFDPAHDAMSRENVGALIDASCDTALELARLDASFASRTGEPGYAPARELFSRRLADAASALGALYASGVRHGTPASDRVAELVDEIRADASARTQAGDEMQRVVGER